MTHIAIIMDGNGRWAKEKGKSRLEGHEAGLRAFQQIVCHAAKSSIIKFLTVYAFSVQNWGRPVTEIKGLFRLSKQYFSDLALFKTHNVRLRILGSLELYPSEVQKTIQTAVFETATNTGLTVTVALSYGGREEIVETAERIRSLNHRECITQEMFERLLNPESIPDPDLIIRTSGEFRVSNFLLWQSAYSEYLILDKFWPDFTELDLDSAILTLQQRNRRFGKLAVEVATTNWPNESVCNAYLTSIIQEAKIIQTFPFFRKYQDNPLLKAKYFQIYQQVLALDVSEKYELLTESFLLSIPALSPDTHNWIAWLIFAAWLQNWYSLKPDMLQDIFRNTKGVLDQYRQLKQRVAPDGQIEEDLKEKLISLTDYHRELYIRLETHKSQNPMLGLVYALYPILGNQCAIEQVCQLASLIMILFWSQPEFPTVNQFLEIMLQKDKQSPQLDIALYTKVKTALLYLYIFAGSNVQTLHWSHVLRYLEATLSNNI